MDEARVRGAHHGDGRARVRRLSSAIAQSRNETLLVVTESGPNSMDIHGVGANRPSYQASWNLYDRLLTYGVKKLPDGTRMYDYSRARSRSWPRAGRSRPTACR